MRSTENGKQQQLYWTGKNIDKQNLVFIKTKIGMCFIR